MQKLISKYGLAAHLAFLAVAPLFLFPHFAASTIATVELWLSLFAAIWLVMEPSRRAGEMLHDARFRVMGAILHDPLFWVMVALTLFAGLRWANTGVGTAYDLEKELWSIRSPHVAIFPGSVKDAGFLPFSIALAATVLLAGCRHALGKAARMSYLFTSSSLAGLAAIVGAILLKEEHPAIQAATKCVLTNASYVGAAFGLHFLAAVAVLPGVFECRWNKLLILFALSIGGTATGLYFFSPVVVTMAFLAAGLLLLIAALAYSGFFLGGSTAFKCAASLVVSVLIPVLCVMWLSSDEVNAARLPVLSGDFDKCFADGFAETRDLLSSISSKVWEENRWMGTGIGSFALDVRFNAAPEDWSVLKAGQLTPLNGWWYLLVERGIVGALALALVLAFLCWTFIRRLIAALGKDFFFPACVLGPVACLVIVAETFIDTSFLRMDVMLALAGQMAIAASFFPVPVAKAKKEDVKLKAGN